MGVIKDSFTFDDVTLVPQYSSVLPSETITVIKLSNNLNLKIPLMSSAMDTVTESKMAIAISKLGGIGVIHRNLSIEEQVMEIKKAKKNNYDSIIVSASIESQFVELENDSDRIQLLKELGINETTLKKVITAGYSLLDLINYFTCVPKETKSWTIKKNTLAPQAAGKIHSDFEKGFIRAETISYNDFIEFKGESACREAGKLRQEGKDYKVKDGEVINFLFNV